ncbi:hypothetical protein [Methylobacterium oxalidis]|uniref:Uncharacterized protein n=1 Tax=Methylobacterium oxalidis TaxID=944322 RepID=A0A512J5U5_9HYPH|nr:hypothetical protein [Methylobacterium oxalidis]GEP05280.1 hypothetical protein MOX02_33180 [Methylobacterium oxalidis]GJE29979.1 hypothetical protein LDDCCGHA_0142 [Methylobacterium oxalidis]GLS64676.1 hypothetical protein GCM10007888_30570 [Methylobacterium oxalidis]
MAPAASVEATRQSSAADGRGAPSQAWIDPPRRLVRARGEETGAAAEGPRGPEPATTGTLTHVAAAVVPGIEGTAHAPLPALKRERTAAPAVKRPSSAQSLRKAQARKAAPPAESPPRPAEQQAAAPRPVALAGPLGDILRGLGFVEGQKPAP